MRERDGHYPEEGRYFTSLYTMETTNAYYHVMGCTVVVQLHNHN